MWGDKVGAKATLGSSLRKGYTAADIPTAQGLSVPLLKRSIHATETYGL